jgi:cell division protein FtsN
LDYQATPDNDRVAANEEGEFELVLGNRQLLSVFFVAVLLLAVFFTMGYIVGRNLSPDQPLVADASRPSIIDADPAPVPSVKTPEPDKPVAMPSNPVAQLPKPDAQPESLKPEPTKPETTKPTAIKTEPPKAAVKPPATPPKPEPAKPAVTKTEPPKAPAAKPEPVKPPAATAVKPPTPPPAAPVKPPAAGSYYLQVAAATPDKVNGLVAALKGKGFQTTTQPVPGGQLVRVLVGPYDANSATDGAAKLKSAGYDSLRKKL